MAVLVRHRNLLDSGVGPTADGVLSIALHAGLGLVAVGSNGGRLRVWLLEDEAEGGEARGGGAQRAAAECSGARPGECQGMAALAWWSPDSLNSTDLLGGTEGGRCIRWQYDAGKGSASPSLREVQALETGEVLGLACHAARRGRGEAFAAVADGCVACMAPSTDASRAAAIKPTVEL